MKLNQEIFYLDNDQIEITRDNKCFCTLLHEECLQHHGHKGDPGVTLGTCSAIGERAQVILMWVRALGIENASHQ